MQVTQKDALAVAMKLMGGADKLGDRLTQGGAKGVGGADAAAELAAQVAEKLGGGPATKQVALDALMAFQHVTLERGRTAVTTNVVAKGDATVTQGQRSVGSSALGAVRMNLLDGVDAAKVKQFNLKGVALPKEIARIADQTFGAREARIATAGYSAPPDGTKYAEHAEAFLGTLADKLGLANTGFTTSPTADAGSIDAITTMIGQKKGVPVLSITSKDYVGYIDPAKFPPGIDQAAYAKGPKHVFSDNAKYNQATALASTAFVGVGGRDVTVYDFMRAIEKGNPVVLLVDDSMKAPMGGKAVWDADKKRPNNGSAYLAEQITSFLKDGTLPHPEISKDGMGAFTKEWCDDTKVLLQQLVKVVHIDGAADMDAAAGAAAKHINSFVNPSAAEALQGFHAASVDDVKVRVQPQYLESAYQYTALTSSQLADQTAHIPGAAAHAGGAKRLLDDLVHKTVRHFGGGKYAMLDEPHMNAASIKQHAGYIAGEMSRKLGLPESSTRDVLVKFYESTQAGASPAQREQLASDLKGDPAAVKAYVTDAGNGWMFNEYGFGDADKALNRPGVYAGAAVHEFAVQLAGNGAKGLLKRALDRSPDDLAKALADPKTTEDLVACFAARAAQAGWLVSKAGQGIVEANHANPDKAAKGVNRLGPKNDLMTDFDALAAKKGWPEVAKDLDQVKTALWGQGLLDG